MPYVIAQPCVDVKDKACVDECPVDCIYEGARSLYINPNECVDCGACEPVCPTEAKSSTRTICRREWAWYKDAAVSFFAEVGDLGGASAAGSARQGSRAGGRPCRRRTPDTGTIRQSIRPAWPSTPAVPSLKADAERRYRYQPSCIGVAAVVLPFGRRE